MFYSAIKLSDIENLEGTFDYLTEGGWVIPQWLVEFRKYVTERDQAVL